MMQRGVEARLVEALVQRGGDISTRVLSWLVYGTLLPRSGFDIAWFDQAIEW